MDDVTRGILASLDRVDAQRSLRTNNPRLAAAVAAIKQHQHERFAATYADFLADRSTMPACRFFLQELYGPADFSSRDDQFRRIVPGLARFFPPEVSETVLSLSRLHALSEELDGAMGAAAVADEFTAESYQRCWRAVGRAEQREEQIVLMLRVGAAVDRLARQVLLRTSLKLMRGPATAAGFTALQGFLERGLDAFRKLESPKLFLETIANRERQVAAALFTEG